MPESLLHSLSKTRAFRQVPEGMCKRCAGTGNGEEVADLGEALSNGAQFPIGECHSCGGSGMTLAKTEITGVGVMLLLVMVAAIWACPPRVRSILILSSASIAILEAALWRRQTLRKNTEVTERKQTTDLPGPTTEGVLSLNTAIESRRQTTDQTESQLTRGGKSTA
jgi:hypothetical protein